MEKGKELFRDLLILLFGLAGIACFFYSFSVMHPLTIEELTHSKDRIVEKADSVFQSWQFKPVEFHPKASFDVSGSVIDSLQKKWGVKEFKQQVVDSEFLIDLPLIRWEVSEFNTGNDETEIEATIGLTPDGRVVSFSASTELITNQRPFNRYAVRHVFQNQVENYSRGLEDSLITGLTNYQHFTSGSQSSNEQEGRIIDQLRELRGEDEARYYSMDNIWDLSEFYLDRTVWRNYDLEQDSVKIMDEGGIRFARTFYTAQDSLSDIRVNLTMDVMPAGSIKSLDFTIFPAFSADNDALTNILESISLFLILTFVIWLLFVFYLRIKARAIDTRPAMIIAVVAGFIVPGFWILQFIYDFGFIFGETNTNQIINGLMLIAVLGAISAMGFFVMTAVSDSITRQYWPQKLKTLDLVRRGLFVNKPVGWAIINAISLGGFLAGSVGLFLMVIPGSYISAGTGLISDNYFLPSIANLMVTAMMVLVIVVPIFLIIGNQVKGVIKREWVIPALSAFLFGLLNFLPFSIEPDLIDRAMGVVFGLILGYFYIRYDILTIVFGFFIFLNLLSTSKGWVMEGSPDANAFSLFVLVVITLSGLGIYFIAKGSDRKELPEYVPAYIEDQAKEQRLKQELSIARVVQQAFLPSKIHHFPGIDIAGVCIPAQETGGDYYDMISLGEQRTAIAIGDVSGKGIRAAFYMTFTKGVLHSLSALILSPVELLNQLNRLFKENATRGTFISMIYGILEADKRKFTFARAGHNPMLVIRSNGDTEWLKPAGVGIGMTNGDNFLKCTQEASLKLKEGDVAILYTDGITEMLNSGNHFYGEDRLERLVKGVRKASSEKILEIIVDDVNEFKGMARQHDDMTLVIIKADASVNQ
ncbi:MAG: SpoIIE family protein phosphatase [Gracilimonas sp.]|uniref:PP2C family protein-serine/threonine phosphatase n=1 Tax=Gracilimonas sp. TaxID=1974203 RepID=UPI003752BA12|nr:SpoIIE family protein phosphatase [Gracilimonas sp.]